MQDEQPTHKSEADPLVVPPRDADAPTGSEEQILAFDASAFENAASQFRPSWESIPSEAQELTAEPPNDSPALPEGALPVRARAALPPAPDAAALPRQAASSSPNVVVPRPPRAPQVDYAPQGPHDDDDFGLSAAGIPTSPMRMWWIAAAAFLIVGTIGFVLMRSSDDGHANTPYNRTASQAPTVEALAVEAPAPVVPDPAVPVVPEPSTAVASPTPSAPAVSAPVIPKPVSPAPERAAAREKPSARSERRSAASPARVATPARTTSSKAATTNKPKTVRRGAGFVSTNPY